MNPEFLLTLFSDQQPRRSHVIFALLKQQTTGSTEYWGLRYNLLDWIGLLPQLNRSDYENMIMQLVQTKNLEQTDAGLYVLTKQGKKLSDQYPKKHFMLKQPYERYVYQTGSFIPLFLLANQVVSEWSYANQQYYPIQMDLKQRQLIKQWFKQSNKQTLVTQWHQTLANYLQTLNTTMATQLAATWVGHATAGLNFDQLHLPDTWDAFDFYLWQLAQYTELLKYLEQQISRDNPMVQLYAFVGKKQRFSNSLQASYQAINANKTLVQIAQQRHLKLGTVQEHLLTAAIWLPIDQFPYERYLTPAVQTYFKQRLTDSNIDNWHFGTVRQSDDIQEFFNFRLYEIWMTKQEQTHG